MADSVYKKCYRCENFFELSNHIGETVLSNCLTVGVQYTNQKDDVLYIHQEFRRMFCPECMDILFKCMNGRKLADG